MNRKLPPDTFAYYLDLGVGRSYQAVADNFGVTKQAVVKLAAREKWQERLQQIEKSQRNGSLEVTVSGYWRRAWAVSISARGWRSRFGRARR